MDSIPQLLDAKGRGVWSVSPDDSVFDAIKKMADRMIGSLVVLEEDSIVGIITERHYTRNVILKGKSSLSTPVRDIMETRVICVNPEHTLEECMAVMTEKRIRHLPVIDQGRLVGLISIGDLVKTIIKDQQFTIDQLTHYICG